MYDLETLRRRTRTATGRGHVKRRKTGVLAQTHRENASAPRGEAVRKSDTQEESAGTRRFTESNSCWTDSDIAIREPECVAIKRRAQEHVRRLIEGMTIDEELEFWRKRTEEMRARQKANRPESERSDSASRPTWPFSYPPPIRRLSATTKPPSATTAPKPWSSPTSKPSPPATPPPTWPCRLARPGDNSP